MPYLDVEAGRLFFDQRGSGANNLVFAHGLGGNHLSWWQQVPAFEATHRCTTFSHRGFAPSTGVPEPAAFAADLVSLLDHLELEEVTLIAQSMGGWTSIEFALAHRDRVRALVLASTTGTLGFGRDPGVLSKTESAVRELRARGIHPAAGARLAAEKPAMHYLYQGIDALSWDLDKESLRAKLVAARNRKPDQLYELNRPVLWIFGEEDPLFPGEVVDSVRATYPDHQLKLFPETGHSVYFERPAGFNRVVAEFLTANGL